MIRFGSSSYSYGYLGIKFAENKRKKLERTLFKYHACNNVLSVTWQGKRRAAMRRQYNDAWNLKRGIGNGERKTRNNEWRTRNGE